MLYDAARDRTLERDQRTGMRGAGKKLSAQLILLLITAGLFAGSWGPKNFPLLLVSFASLSVCAASISRKLLPPGIVVAATFLSLAAAEVVMAAFSPPKVHHDPSSGYVSGRYFNKDTKLGYKATEGVFDSRKYTADNDVIYDVVYTIGKDGFRKTPSDRSAKINVFGGSFAFGEGLNDDETFSFYLRSDHGLISKNWGIHGYGLHQALFLLQNEPTTRGKEYNILLTGPWHALRSGCKVSYSYRTPRYEIVDGDLQYKGSCGTDSLPGRFRFVRNILGKSKIWALVSNLLNRPDMITADDVELYLLIIREIQKISKKDGTKVVIAYMKESEQKLSESGFTNADIVRELSKVGDVVVDVTLGDSIEALDRRYFIHELDIHPSAAANKERARLLATYLKN